MIQTVANSKRFYKTKQVEFLLIFSVVDDVLLISQETFFKNSEHSLLVFELRKEKYKM